MLRFEDFPTHVQLMLLAARTRLREGERAAIQKLVADGMEWERFLQVVEHHRVSPLVFSSLDQVRPAGLPDAVRETLRLRARVNAFEAVRSVSEVRRLAEGFAGAGVEISVMKGVALSQELFGNPNARHVGDIDLLVTGTDGAAQLPKQIALLAALGYERINPVSRLTPMRIASYMSFWKDATFRSAASGFELDLHWRLFNNRFHAANRMLTAARYETVTVFSVPMRVFSLRDQFIYISAHGALDAWTYLKGLADVAAFLRLFTAEQLDEALARSEELGLLAQMSSAVHLANDWMGAGVSSRRLLAHDEPTAVTVRERTTAMLLKQDFLPVRNYPSPAQWLRLEMALVPGLRSLIEVARRYVWRPRVWTSVDLPDQLFWIYPLLGLLLPPRVHVVKE